MTGPFQKPRLLRGALGFPVVAVAFAVYLATLAPTVTFDDSGELIASAASLGIPHPSGYPLFALWGHLFTLIPAGKVAWRVNLASAAAAAAAAGTLFLLLRRVLSGGGATYAAYAAAAAGALAFAFSRAFWSQAAVTEVYSVNALVLVSFLFAASRYAESRDFRWVYAAAFLGGLSFAGHSSALIIIVPATVYFAASRTLRPGWRTTLFIGLLFLWGAALYVYLPLRAVQEPSLNWGDPRTLGRWWFHVARRGYGGAVWLRARFIPDHLVAWAALAFKQFTPVGAVVGAAGVIWGAVTAAKKWAPWWALAAAAGPLAAVLLAVVLRTDQIREIGVWHITFFIFQAVFIAAGLYAGLTARAVWIRCAAGAASLAVVAAPLVVNSRYDDYRGYYYAEDWGGNFLRTTAFGGVNMIFGRGYVVTFPTAYLKKVEHRRPDETFADMSGHVFRPFPAFGYGPAAAPSGGTQAWACALEMDLLSSADAQPTYYYESTPELRDAGFAAVPEGLLLRVYRIPPLRREITPVWRRYIRRGAAAVAADPLGPRFVRDDPGRTTSAFYSIAAAREYFEIGDRRRALATLASAAHIARGAPEPLSDIAYLYLIHGEYSLAISYYNQAIIAFPRGGIGDGQFRLYYAQLWAHKGYAYERCGDFGSALNAYNVSLTAYPDQPAVREAIAALARMATRPDTNR